MSPVFHLYSNVHAHLAICSTTITQENTSYLRTCSCSGEIHLAITKAQALAAQDITEPIVRRSGCRN